MSELHIRRMNEGATMPLIIPVSVLINTPTEVLFDHIRENSKNISKWVKQLPAHDGVALLCGSGPSLVDDLEDIMERQKAGAKVFALNAAAKFLNGHGIFPDCQAMIDAKEESMSLIGPAREYFFGSTVDPRCFHLKPDATLFHLQVDDDDLQAEIDNYAPHDYSMLTTAVSVGVVATVLAFVLGYRKLHFYGYDSSHKGNDSHVTRQEMNDVVACMNVEFCGKEYVSSLPMKLQAERFMQVANLLKGEGCEINMHGYGLLPDMYRAPHEKLSEKEKYFRMWSMVSYRQDSPAERIIDDIEKFLKPDSRVVDFGCGTGRAGAILKNRGYDVLLVDFAPNCRDDVAAELPFIELDLTESIPLKEKYGYCVDVMEHIPPEDVDKVIVNIMNAAEKVFFQISTVQDKMGSIINDHLHLTVESHEQWLDRFLKLGFIVSHDQKYECESVFVVTT